MRTIISLLYLTFTLCAAGCEEPLETNFNLFTIAAHEHYCNERHAEFLQSTRLRFQARFDSTAVYTLAEGFQDSKNKLLGFADRNSAHHENSARFAWQWYNDRLEIYAYCYMDGVRSEAFVGTVALNETVDYEISLTDDSYVFKLKEKTLSMPRNVSGKVGAYYMLWPYFGGQLPAPHTINIMIRRF